MYALRSIISAKKTPKVSKYQQYFFKFQKQQQQQKPQRQVIIPLFSRQKGKPILIKACWIKKQKSTLQSKLVCWVT